MAAGLSLSSSARLAFIGLSYVYIIKLIDTLWHGIFTQPAVSFIVVSLNILAGIAQFIFFYELKSATSHNGIFSRIAGWSGTIGALISILPKILALSVLLQFYFSLSLIKHSQLIAVLSPWLGTAMLFCSCLIFFLITVTRETGKTRAFFLGSIGYLVLAVTFSMLVLNYLSGLRVNWQTGAIQTSLTYFIISASFSFLCIAYFYSGFFYGNERIENDETH